MLSISFFPTFFTKNNVFKTFPYCYRDSCRAFTYCITSTLCPSLWFCSFQWGTPRFSSAPCHQKQHCLEHTHPCPFMDLHENSLRSMPWSRIARMECMCVCLMGPNGATVFSRSSQPVPSPAVQKAPHVPTALPTLGTVQLANFCRPNRYKLYLFMVFFLVHLPNFAYLVLCSLALRLLLVL